VSDDHPHSVENPLAAGYIAANSSSGSSSLENYCHFEANLRGDTGDPLHDTHPYLCGADTHWASAGIYQGNVADIHHHTATSLALSLI
jgi:hypothetical protein